MEPLQKKLKGEELKAHNAHLRTLYGRTRCPGCGDLVSVKTDLHLAKHEDLCGLKSRTPKGDLFDFHLRNHGLMLADAGKRFKTDAEIAASEKSNH